MDNSKINQTELSYNCKVGSAKVNIYTGRLLYEYQDANIGLESYEIALSHIYNSHYSTLNGENSSVGEGWKLNIQQYIYFSNDKYYYIDGFGKTIEFEMLSTNIYYDNSGLGMKLEIFTNHCEISDVAGNTMYFVNNRLTKTVSCENSSIEKNFVYNDNKIIAMYDSRTPDSKFLFEYNNELLSQVSVIVRNVLKYKIKYYYEECILKSISKVVDDTEKPLIGFKYENDKLQYAVSLDDGSGFRFYYSSDKLSAINIGYAELEKIMKESSCIQCGNELYCGENKYLGEKQYNEVIRICDGMNNYGINLLRFNQFRYRQGLTEVVNEKSIKLLYYNNAQGYTSSILESLDENNEDLRTLKKMPGRSMLNENGGNSTEKINTIKSFLINTGDIISTENGGLMNGRLSFLSDYRKNVCPDYLNYTVSIWLKVLSQVNNPLIKLSVTSKNNTPPDVSYARFDNSLIDGWQEIRVPITIKYDSIKKIEVEFLENDNTKYIKISDMRLYYSSINKIMISDGIHTANLEKISKISYTTTGNSNDYIDINIDETNYISEKDLQLSFMSLFKNHNNNCGNYVLFYSDGTKQVYVKNARLITENNDIIPISFYTDNYSTLFNSTNSRTSYYTEIISPDGDLFVDNLSYFINNYNINSENYNVLINVIEGNKYAKVDDNGHPISAHKEGYEIKCLDLKGKLLFEQNEYGVQKIYKYDINGVQCQTKIINKNDNSQYLVLSKNTSIDSQEITNEVLRKKIYYNGNNIEKIETNGINGELSTKYEQFFNFNFFNDKIKSTYNSENENNYISYDNCGNIIEVTSCKDSDYGKYGFKFKYDKFGDPTQFFYSYGPSKSPVDNLIAEKIINREEGTIKTKYHRSNADIDEITTSIDNYGRINEIDISGNKVYYQRSDLWESPGATNVSSIVDEIGDKTYHFEYDDFNNLKEYRYNKSDNSEIKINKSSSNMFNFNEKFCDNPGSYNYSYELNYDSDKVLNSRIDTSSFSCNFGLRGYYQFYEYDSLGRIRDKTFNIYNNFDNNGIIIKESKTFKNITGQIENKNVCIKDMLNEEEKMNINFSNYYDDRGNISRKETCITDNNQSSTYRQSYQYNNMNKVINEYNERTNSSYEYNYRNDGSIDYINNDGVITNYIYGQNGRLSSIRSYEITLNLMYDNLGNVITYGSNNYTWTRGNLLSSYSNLGQVVNYYYDGFGKISKKVFNGTVVNYKYDNDKLISEEWNTGIKIIYLYDIEEIIGFIKIEDNYSNVYYYVKDLEGNVVSIINNGSEVARYEYDSFGKHTILYSVDDIANLNSIRWKSLFYEKDGNLYFINNNYYDPILKQYLSMNVVEEMISKATLVGGINPYSINVNSINTSQFTLEPVLDIVYDPAVKSRWSRFWSSLIGQLTACLLTIVALVITIFTQTWALYIASLASALIGLTIGGVISGIQSKSVGKGFWNGFSNYINEEWSQTLGVAMAIYIISIGVSRLINSMTDCFIAGTLVLTSLGLIKIEEIKKGDYVYAYNEKTRKKELKKVKQVFRNKTKEWFHLFFKNFENGNVQEIICTSNHRIFIKNKGWTKACEIEENDKVVLFNDKELVVERMFNQPLDDYEIIYNFEVEDLHNYYVGEEMILVHNDCRSLQRQQYWKNESYELKGENITYELTSENKSRMANGFAPKGFDNYSVELHHVKGIRKDFLDVVQIQKTDHILFHKIYGYKDFINIRTLAEFSSKIR